MKKIAYKKMAEFESSHFWFLGREQICLSLIDEINKNNSIEKILDYGCGTGRLVKKLKELYPQKEIWGADISDRALKYCHKKSISNLIDLKKTSPQENCFDLILCLDVLEHIDKDVDSLRKMKNFMKKSGQLLIMVPAYNFLWSGEDYVSKHAHRYRQQRLKKKLIQAGFHINRASYFNTFLFLPLVAVVLAKRIFRPKTMYTSDVKDLNSRLNKVLTKIFISEKYFLKHISFPFGASIFVIAEK